MGRRSSRERIKTMIPGVPSHSGRLRANPAGIREKDIQRAILDYLELKRVFHWRNNKGAFAGEYKGKKRFIRFGGLPGAPDVMAVVGGRFIGIEVKGPGGRQSEDQCNYALALSAAGGIYILAHDLDAVKSFIEGLRS